MKFLTFVLIYKNLHNKALAYSSNSMLTHCPLHLACSSHAGFFQSFWCRYFFQHWSMQFPLPTSLFPTSLHPQRSLHDFPERVFSLLAAPLAICISAVVKYNCVYSCLMFSLPKLWIPWGSQIYPIYYCISNAYTIVHAYLMNNSYWINT